MTDGIWVMEVPNGTVTLETHPKQATAYVSLLRASNGAQATVALSLPDLRAFSVMVRAAELYLEDRG